MLSLSVGGGSVGKVVGECLRFGSQSYRMLGIRRPASIGIFSLRSRLPRNMRQLTAGPHALSKEVQEGYEEAVMTLNTLQSNAAYLEKSKAERDRKRHLSLPQTLQTAKRVGITVEDLDKLNIIHISGTKGKGSTCAFVESILRNHGYRTGFFSSPHLVEVRERLRINGKPIKKDVFSSYFWTCYKQLEASKDSHDGDMPTYFRFLTVMAFYMFVKEKVDAAIIEVGIGGEYDCTNIIRNPVVCGVTSLGIDHTSLLGHTLDQIAWHKAGIFKPGVPAVTIPQPDNSIQVLLDRAYEKGCPLYLAPESVSDYEWPHDDKALGIPGMKQSTNASLAIQLCRIWLKDHDKDVEEKKQEYADYINRSLPKTEFIRQAEKHRLDEPTEKGLSQCYWPGRCQTLTRPQVTYFLDGAHTPRSLEVCAQWFKEVSRAERKLKSGKVVSVLLFNTTGDRQPESLLEQLLSCDFDVAVFCPNITSRANISKADQANYMVTDEMQLAKCEKNAKSWLSLVSRVPRRGNTVPDSRLPLHNGCQDLPAAPDARSDTGRPSNGFVLDADRGLVSNGELRQGGAHTELFGSILESLHWITQGRDLTLPPVIVDVPPMKSIEEADHVQVLCTGSLHLIGGILALLEPNISDK